MTNRMSKKDMQILRDMLNTPDVKKPETLSEYLESNPEVRRIYWVSKRETELVTVYFPNGKVNTYEVRNLETTKAFEV